MLNSITLSKMICPNLKIYGFIEPTSMAQALSCPEWKLATEEEYNTLLSNYHWDLVRVSSTYNVDARNVRSIWSSIVMELFNYKTCLVTKCTWRTPRIDFIGTFNPLVKTGTIQIGLSNVVLLNWDILQIDVNDAIFNGQSYKTVYMSYPKGFIQPHKPNDLCLLKNTL